MAARLIELESAWLQQAQHQAAERWSTWTQGAAGAAGVTAPPGDGADDAAREWQQWFTRWQEGVGEISRAWNDALRAVQPRA